MDTRTKRLLFWLAGIVALLLLPLMTMQFTQEVNWGLSDFIIAGILLASAALAYELIVRKAGSKTKRIILTIVLISILLLIWGELAVGIFSSPFAGS